MKNLIYLDNNSTTITAPSVIDAMVNVMKYCPYNPSSTHQLGQEAKKYLIEARKAIASFFFKKTNRSYIYLWRDRSYKYVYICICKK